MKQFGVKVIPGRGCRVVKGDLSDCLLINPDLSRVRKLPPEFWKVVNGQVLPMEVAKQAEVLDGCYPERVVKRSLDRNKWYWAGWGFITGVGLMTTLWILDLWLL